MQPSDEPRVSFDGQAAAYDERAGLPEAVCREIASFVLEGVAASATVIDVGAGTGMLAQHLLRGDIRYVGLDVSRPMLLELSRRVTARGRMLLVQADADAAWPLGDHGADVILFSRSAHLLKSERAVDEVLRIAAPRARVWIGRVRRPRDCAAEQLKRAMQQMLREREVPGRNGERAKRDFLEALARRGATPLPLRVTREFVETEAPIESLRSWAGKQGLGGRVLPEPLKREILDELERWAREHLGDLTTPRPVSETYELEGMQLGG